MLIELCSALIFIIFQNTHKKRRNKYYERGQFGGDDNYYLLRLVENSSGKSLTENKIKDISGIEEVEFTVRIHDDERNEVDSSAVKITFLQQSGGAIVRLRFIFSSVSQNPYSRSRPFAIAVKPFQ